MSPGQTGHITGQMGRVPGTDGTHTRGCPAKILYVYWFFPFPSNFMRVMILQRMVPHVKDHLFWEIADKGGNRDPARRNQQEEGTGEIWVLL